MDNSEVIATFCSITGAQPHVADHYLSACNFDLNRGIEFFMENPPEAGTADAEPGSPPSRDPSPPPFAPPNPAPGEYAMHLMHREQLVTLDHSHAC